MNVTQAQIVRRGLTNCCPNCGNKTLFSPEKPLTLNRNCPECGLKLEREDGFFLGAMAINYGVTCFVFLAPVAILWAKEILSDTAAAVIGLAGAFLVPLALYRSSRSWQLMLYYFFLPQHLPANRRELSTLEDENV
jgi:uncharacterized protein (DUF983 family)